MRVHIWLRAEISNNTKPQRNKKLQKISVDFEFLFLILSGLRFNSVLELYSGRYKNISALTEIGRQNLYKHVLRLIVKLV